jgi:hypothetical protein
MSPLQKVALNAESLSRKRPKSEQGPALWKDGQAQRQRKPWGWKTMLPRCLFQRAVDFWFIKRRATISVEILQRSKDVVIGDGSRTGKEL